MRQETLKAEIVYRSKQSRSKPTARKQNNRKNKTKIEKNKK
jgi:hypothetical protein